MSEVPLYCPPYGLWCIHFRVIQETPVWCDGRVRKAYKILTIKTESGKAGVFTRCRFHGSLGTAKCYSRNPVEVRVAAGCGKNTRS